MKKSLLILSMMAIAATAVAYDAPTAGTAENPNYYVIKANRGIPYLAYGESQQSQANSKLTRTNDITEANIWAITPGSAEGTVTIKSYTADAYLLDFVDAKEEPTVAANATAVTVTTPTNLYLVENNGAYAININSATGASYPNNCISLDAPGGTKDYCGNYVPTNPANGEGSAFWFYQVDMSNGAAAGIAAVTKVIEDEANADAIAAFNSQKELYLNTLNTYKENVPQVADIIATGIASLEALEFSKDYAEKISTIWSNTFNQANESIKTVLNGNTYAIKNLRRVTSATEGAYLTVGDGKYVGSTAYTSANSLFTFTATSDGGYTIYNAATNSWIGAGATLVTTEAEAHAYYPVINSFDSFYGIQFKEGANSSNGLNWQSWNNGSLSIWSVSDGGSIWVLVDFDTEKAVSDAIESASTQLSQYAENLPMLEEIFSEAIGKMNELTFSDDLGDQINAIKDKALADANTLLATGLVNKVVTLKNLRQDMYLGMTETGFLREANGDHADAAITLKAAEGGYNAFNEATGKYIGKSGEYSTATYATGENNFIVSDEAEAIVIVPVLAQSGSFAGVSLNVVGQENIALNMNANDNLWYYNANDGGSIWGINEVKVTDSLSELSTINSQLSIIYDLQGRRLAAPIKGINIINGKKVLVK